MSWMRIEAFAGWDFLIPEKGPEYTPNEPFVMTSPSEGHVYDTACKFAVSRLGSGEGRRCLVAGSPPFEVHALESAGWNVTLVDVRRPPDRKLRWVGADVSRLPFPDSTFDALSSTCCFCHVGLGRYGDPCHPEGDIRALSEAFRVLKPGSRAAVMLGPSVPTDRVLPKTIVSGVTHRIYKPADAMERVQGAGFRILETGFWEVMQKTWLDPQEVETYYCNYLAADQTGGIPYCYLDFLLEKPR